MTIKKSLFACVLIVLLLLPTAACGLPEQVTSSAPVDPERVSTPNKQEPVPPHRELTLLAAGDNLIHDVIYNQARRRGSDGKYDFAPAYSAVSPIIRDADIAVINQETILASDIAEPSSYPRFCSPTELGEQLLEIGFDVFTQANNHSYDKGAEGIRANMDFWDNHPQALTVGMYRDAAERNKIRYTEVNGIKLAFLAAAEQTNGLTLPSDAPEGVWMLSDAAHLSEQISEAHENADFVVVSPHWGVEGADKPSADQRSMANRLVQWGADLVLGTHPHVLQPCETVTRADGTQGLVVYSLGNFISAQQGGSNMAGGLLEVTIEKDGDSRAAIAGHSFIPTVTHYGAGYAELRVIPFAQYTDTLAAAHGVHQYTKRFDMEYLTGLYRATYPDCAVLTNTVSNAAPMSYSMAVQPTTTQPTTPPQPTTAPQSTPTQPSAPHPTAPQLTTPQPTTAPPQTTPQPTTPQPTTPPSVSEMADAELDALCKKYNVVGMSIAAFSGEQVVYTHSYGLANVEKKIPATADTFYRTASIAKAITTMATLQLYDDGSIDLDADISDYIGFLVRNPNHPNEIITTRQLMTHTAGVIDSGAYYDAIMHTPFSGLSSLMKHNIFSPYLSGRIYIYSNLSAGMVGCVAQGAANEHLWSLAQRRLFTPLGVSATYLSKTIPNQGSIAHIYSGGEKTFDPIASGTAESYYKRIPPGEMYMLGHGDLYITAPDLARLGMVLAGDGEVGNVRILKADTVKAVNSLQFHVDPKPENIPEIFRGLGVQLLPEMLPDMDFAGHQGNAYGMMGCLLYRPEKGTGVALLTNGCNTGQRDGVVYNINRDVTEVLYRLVL